MPTMGAKQRWFNAQDERTEKLFKLIAMMPERRVCLSMRDVFLVCIALSELPPGAFSYSQTMHMYTQLETGLAAFLPQWAHQQLAQWIVEGEQYTNSGKRRTK